MLPLAVMLGPAARSAQPAGAVVGTRFSAFCSRHLTPLQRRRHVRRTVRPAAQIGSNPRRRPRNPHRHSIPPITRTLAASWSGVMGVDRRGDVDRPWHCWFAEGWMGDVAGERGDRSALSDAYNGRRGSDARRTAPRSWHPWLQLQTGGGPPCPRGHEGVREGSEAGRSFRNPGRANRDPGPGERVVAIGHHRGRGKESGAITESPLAGSWRVESGKVIRVARVSRP